MTNKRKKPNLKSKLSKGKRDIVFVQWMDHCSSRAASGWVDPKDRDMYAVECESIGFRVHEDDDVLVLSISQDASGNINDTMHIIKSCITKRRKLM